ncbi:hypothetical protein NL676_002124 [Syzygium grande]|nr:hypothetical protein NL676_002124 [Syzygium grande]
MDGLQAHLIKEEVEGAAGKFVEETRQEAAATPKAPLDGGGSAEEAGGEGAGNSGGEWDEGGEALGDGEAMSEGPRVMDTAKDVEEEVVWYAIDLVFSFFYNFLQSSKIYG